VLDEYIDETVLDVSEDSDGGGGNKLKFMKIILFYVAGGPSSWKRF
jgi:hypothetical protein